MDWIRQRALRIAWPLVQQRVDEAHVQAGAMVVRLDYSRTGKRAIATDALSVLRGLVLAKLGPRS